MQLTRRIFRKVLQNWPVRALEEAQRRLQHALLERGVVGRAKRTTKDERHPKGPWRADRFRVLAHQADASGGDAFVIDVQGECAHGERAVWSDRCEDDRVHPFLQEHAPDFTRLCFHARDRRPRTHERVVMVCDRSNGAVSR